jgi:hypothetical protein
MEYLDLMGSQIAQLCEEGKEGSASPFYQKLESAAEEFALNLEPSSLWLGFQDIHNRRWWSRIWVIQEEALSQSAFLVCGGKATPYDNFQALFDVIADEESRKSLHLWKSLNESLYHALIRFNARLPYLGSPSMLKDVFDFLMLTRHLQSSDPRDHVFGLLGISEAMKDALPSPDYSKSAAWLFTEVTKTVIIGLDSINVLWSASNDEARITLELPSWVPDWSNPPVLNVPKFSHNVYNAARNSEAEFGIDAETQELKALGKFFDTLIEIPIVDLKAYNAKSTAFEQMLGWQASFRLVFSTLLSYPTEEALRDALWRTLCWNLGSQHENPSPKENVEDFERWYVQVMNHLGIEGQAMHTKDPFHSLVEDILAPICITAKGYLASAPYTTKKGDWIVILTGGCLPFVLRPTGDHYRLIGPCYVHRIMNGEAFTDDGSDLEWFSIR